MRSTDRSLAVLAATVLHALPVAQKATDVRISDVPANPNRIHSRVAASGSQVYVVWEDWRSNRDVYFDRSLDGGATWRPSDVRLNTRAPGSTHYAEQPEIAASGDTVYAVWEDYRDGHKDVYFNRSPDGGTTWLATDRRINTDRPGANAANRPQITASGAYVYVVWYDTRNAVAGGYDIYFNRSADHGATWLSADVRINTNPPAAAVPYLPRVAAVGNSVYVTWQDSRVYGSRGSTVHFNRSTDGGANWLAADVRLDTQAGPHYAREPEVVASGTSVFVVWRDSRNSGTRPSGDIYCNRSLDRGTTWLTADVRVDRNLPGIYEGPPAVAMSGNSVYVAWNDRRNGGGDVYFNRSGDAGRTWLAADLRLNHDPPGSRASFGPRLAASGSAVFALWQDARSGSSEIFFNRSLDGGATWLGADVRLNTDNVGNEPSRFPQLAVSGNSVYAVWHDKRSGNSEDVYFNIPFGFQPYGTGKPGSGGIQPRLVARGLATIGSAPTLDLSDGLGGTNGALLIGVQKASVPWFGGTVLVWPLLAVPLALGGTPGVPGDGRASLQLALPDVAALVGANLDFQALLVDSGSPFGVSMTAGVEMWIG